MLEQSEQTKSSRSLEGENLGIGGQEEDSIAFDINRNYRMEGIKKGSVL
jgi:hypothetical protein